MWSWWWIAIALIARAAGPASEQQAASLAVELVDGVSTERALARGETHTYRLALTAGEHVRVVVKGSGVRLSVTASTPDGQSIPTYAWNHRIRPETIIVVATRAGEYAVDVKAVSGGDDTGNYLIRIDERRPAVAADQHRVAAQEAWARAQQQRARGVAESFREAIASFSAALQHWQAAGDRVEQALTLGFLGSLHFSLGEYQQALDFHSRALSLHRIERDRLGEGEALNNIGTARFSMGELESARQSYLLALPIQRETGDRQAEASTLNNLGSVHWAIGDPERALEYYHALLPVRRALRDRSGEARTLNNIGTVYQDMADHQLALDAYLQALPLRRAAGDRAGEATTLTNLGRIHVRLGRFAESLEFFDESLRLAQTLGDRPREAAALRAMAGAQQSLGRLEPAIDAADRALALFRSLDARWDEGLTLTHLARLHAERGDLDLASRTSGAALDVCRAVGASRCQAHALNQMGEIALARREWEPAIGHFRQALDLRVAIPDPAGQAETRLGLARAERAQGRLAPAREHAEAALALIESERARIDVDDLRASYFAVKQDAFVLAIDLFMELHARQPAAGYHVLALETSERSRARALLDMLWEAGAEIHEGVAPELRSEERQLRQRLNTLESSRMRSRAAAAGKGDAKNSEGNIQELLEQHRRLRARIRAESPRYASLTDPEPLTAEEIQRNLLDRETVLLHYALGVERSFLWLVTPQRVESFHLPARAVIETAARRAFELLEVGHTRQRRREAARALDTLARMVLGPVADRVQADRVVVVADGALGYIPFGALPVAAAPLMARHEVVSLPSASALAVLRRETSQRAPAPKLLAVLADPVLEPADPRVPGSNRGGARLEPTLAGPLLRSARDTGVNRFERLVNTRREAEAILALTGEAERLRALDFDASRETALRADLGEYRLLHFATHGLLNSRHPELSGLVLSLVDPRGQPQDGFLRAQDVYNMRLGADLVVLSACRTALGAEIRGEGLQSLVRSFMYAGAPRVVASLWNVRDDATAELMKRFYTGMIRERLAPAAALRQAQLTMSTDDRWSAPYYWAGFVLQGEWR